MRNRLAGSSIFPDVEAAASAEIEFQAIGIGTVPATVKHDNIFISDHDMGYAFVVLSACPPGLIPVPLRRGKDCGVVAGDSVQVMNIGENFCSRMPTCDVCQVCTQIHLMTSSRPFLAYFAFVK